MIGLSFTAVQQWRQPYMDTQCELVKYYWLARFWATAVTQLTTRKCWSLSYFHGGHYLLCKTRSLSKRKTTDTHKIHVCFQLEKKNHSLEANWIYSASLSLSLSLSLSCLFNNDAANTSWRIILVFGHDLTQNKCNLHKLHLIDLFVNPL